MALTGEQTFRGLSMSDAYVKVMGVHHRVVDTSIEDENSTVTWSKTLYADYIVRIYKDVEAYTANPDEVVHTISGSFTPSVSNGVNMNIVKQTYIHLKTLSDFSSLTDIV